MINWFYDSYRILNKVYSEKAYIKQAISDVDIEELNRALTVKTCYGVIEKDIELSFYMNYFAPKNPKLAIRTILKIAMYAIKYLEKKEYAVIDNAVELTKKLGKTGASGFVNAFLRKFVKEYAQVKLPEEESEYLSIKYSCPSFLVKELLLDYGREKAEKILSAEPPLNTLVFYDVDGEKYLTEHGVEYYKTPFNNVFSVKNFVRNGDYDKGIYTFQALGSVAICDIVEPCKNILDCCAAPGGKSVRLSFKCENVTSCDIHEHRVNLINEYAYRMGRNNVKARVADASVFCSEFNQKFDAVLCDSPCSGTGVLNDNPDIKLNRTAESVSELTALQFSIISNVSKYVKRGGYLYYSTCSVLEKENFGVVKRFLESNPEYKLEKLDSALNHIEKEGTNMFLPDISGGLGFFVAKLKREL